MPQDIAVTILFFERAAQTVDCVRGFAGEHNCYVLNNGSSRQSRDTFEKATAHLPNLVHLQSSTNLGVAGGRNRLCAETNEPWLLFVDSDITVETADWLRVFREALARYPDCDAFVPALYQAHESAYLKKEKLIVVNDRLCFEPIGADGLSNYFPGGAALVHRRVFEAFGGYDASMKVGFEDFDLALRFLRAGRPLRVRHLPNVRFVHTHLMPQSHEDQRAARERYDLSALSASFQKLRERHGLADSKKWMRWVKRQLSQMELKPKYRDRLRFAWLHWRRSVT